MKLIKEPKGIDFIVNSEPWSEEELFEFRLLMKKKREQFLKKKTHSLVTA